MLSNNKYQSEDFIYGFNTPMTKERIREIKERFNYLGRSLGLIQSELEMKLGDADYAEEIKELADQVKKQVYQLDHIWNQNIVSDSFNFD